MTRAGRAQSLYIRAAQGTAFEHPRHQSSMAMGKRHSWAFSPILVASLSSIFGRKGAHLSAPRGVGCVLWEIPGVTISCALNCSFGSRHMGKPFGMYESTTVRC